MQKSILSVNTHTHKKKQHTRLHTHPDVQITVLKGLKDKIFPM